MPITKLADLRVRQLNALLEAQGQSVVGNKTSKVAKLIELLKSDEIDTTEIDELQLQPWEPEIQKMRNVMNDIAQALERLTSTQQKIVEGQDQLFNAQRMSTNGGRLWAAQPHGPLPSQEIATGGGNETAAQALEQVATQNVGAEGESSTVNVRNDTASTGQQLMSCPAEAQQQVNPPSTSEESTATQRHSAGNVSPTITDSREFLINRHQLTSSQERPNGHQTSMGQGHVCKMRDIAEVLPCFDPLKKTLTSEQFVHRVEQLQRAYSWTEDMVLFAIQTKMKGVAKDWVDVQPVFRSWSEFVIALRRDFPSVLNVAEVHREMAQRKRLIKESLVEYFYIMLNMGRRGGMDDRSINSHVINGLNDGYITRVLLAMNIATCTELLYSLENLATDARTGGSSATAMIRNNTYIGKSNNDNNNTSTTDKRAPKCYNCNEVGHIAIKCPRPQKKPRCNKCQKIGHEAKDCRVLSTVTKIDEDIIPYDTVPPVIKRIKIDNQDFEAFIDTGSDCSLLCESVKIKAKRMPVAKRLKGFGNAIIEPTEMVETTVDLDERQVQVTFFIVPDYLLQTKVLLGRDVLCKGDSRVIIESGLLQIESAYQGNVKVGQLLTGQQQQSLNKVLGENQKCFAEDISKLGRCNTMVMKIEVVTDRPVVGKRYQVAFGERGKLSEILEGLRTHNIIRESTSAHAASVLLVKKTNGENRMCVDYRALNAVTLKKHYPMPVVEEQLSRLAGNLYFTTLDMTSGYYQIPIEEESKAYTAFLTHEGLFEFNVMPFGLINAPMWFQEMVVNIIKPLKSRHKITSYVDEVIIGTVTVEEGLEVLQEFLEAVKCAGLTLRPSKCTFLEGTVNFLGHVVSGEGIRPGESKTQSIRDMATPTNVTGIRQFLGVTGFFRKFVHNYSQIARPLTNLLKKDILFQWAEEQEAAFNHLKEVICSEPILTLYDVRKQHEVHTDASTLGLSGVLFQYENDNLLPVFYYSRQCSDAESRYSSHELEVLAIVESLQRFRMYLLGTHFRVVTDCNSIATMKLTSTLQPRVARWWLRLQEFDFDCVHRPGSKMLLVDGMSRSPVLPPREPSTVADNVLQVHQMSDNDWIMTLQLQDEKLREIILVLKGQPSDQSAQIKQDYVIKYNRLYRKVNGEIKLVVPSSARWRICKVYHDESGHFGVDRTLDQMQKNFWFAAMRRYVKAFINACPECCLNKSHGGKPEGQMHIDEVLPIPFRSIHLDHLGPFPRSKKGNSYIIVLVCSFCKYVLLRALRNTKTTPVINVLKEFMAVYGQPMRVITDRGTAFTSREFESFLASYGIPHIKTAVRTPRANGQAERVNKTVLASLKCTIENDREWDVALPNLQWFINSQRNSTTKYSPNDLVFSYNLRDVSQNRLVQALSDEHNNEPIDSDFRRQEAADNANQAKVLWKKRFDAKRRKPTQYAAGDLVVTEHVPGATGTSHKLEPLFKGPYIITKVLEFDRYVVEDLPDVPRNRRRYSGILSSDHLKPWCGEGPETDDVELQSDNEDVIRPVEPNHQEGPNCQS